MVSIATQTKIWIKKAEKYCSLREKCTSDAEQWCKKNHLSPEQLKSIITHLKKHSFIDEDRYIESFIKDKINLNKWGKYKIINQLKKKNITESAIQKHINNIDTQEYKSNLMYLIKTSKTSHIESNKLIRKLANKGYEIELIVEYLKKS